MVVTLYMEGGQIVSAIAEAVFDVSPPFFLAKCISYIYPLAGEKSSGSKFHHIPPKKTVTFGGVAAVHPNLYMSTSIRAQQLLPKK